MANSKATVIGGVDTHKHVHHAAVLTTAGELLSTAEFRADRGGYEELLAWMKSHGSIDAIGVEGTGFYGAALSQFLLAAGQKVIEVNRATRLPAELMGSRTVSTPNKQLEPFWGRRPPPCPRPKPVRSKPSGS